MSEKSEKVQEFRGVVEDAIAANIRKIEKGPGRPVGFISYKKEAKFGNLTYTSLDQGDAGLHAFGSREHHLWGVAAPIKILGRSAFLAIQSNKNQEEKLSRRLTINSDMKMIHVSSEIEIDEIEQMEDAINWARSPQLNEEAFGRLALIQPHEVEVVQPRLNEIAGQQAELRESLLRLDENQRRAEFEARNIWIR